MDVLDLAIYLSIGMAAGWIAGTLNRGIGIGVVGNVILGMVGSGIGAFFVNASGIAARSQLRATIIATVCAVIILFVLNQVKRHS